VLDPLRRLLRQAGRFGCPPRERRVVHARSRRRRAAPIVGIPSFDRGSDARSLHGTWTSVDRPISPRPAPTGAEQVARAASLPHRPATLGDRGGEVERRRMAAAGWITGRGRGRGARPRPASSRVVSPSRSRLRA
jgi:hypothetical protein